MTHEPEWCEYGNCRDTSGHEPECVSCHYLYGHRELRGIECYCDGLRAAYQRGRQDFQKSLPAFHAYREGYREGYNDHARSRAYAEQVYGPYTQHGKGENP